MRSPIIGIMTLLCVPAVAVAQYTGVGVGPTSGLGLHTTDDVLWPSGGRFPAYPPEPPDGRRVHFSVAGDYYHDSNLFRLSSSVPPPAGVTGNKSDNIFRLGVGVNADLPVSRQRFLLDAQVDGYKFDSHGVLDHIAYRGGAAWKWQLGNRLAGDMGYTQRRFLSSLAEIQAPVRDLITEKHAFAGGGFFVLPRWRVRGMFDYYKWDHGEVSRETLDNHTVSGTGGLDYVTPANNSIGAQVKYTNGEFPNREVFAGSLVDNRFREIEASAVAHWMVTGKSTFDGRVGYTKRTHSQVSERDFSGVTGRLSYDWTPFAKTLLNFSAWREIRAIEDVTANFVLTRGASFGPNWAPTSKLVFQAKAVYEKRNFQGDPGFAFAATGPQRNDIFRGFRLGAGYTPRRYMDLAVAWERGERDSNVLGRDYVYNRWSANAKLHF